MQRCHSSPVSFLLLSNCDLGSGVGVLDSLSDSVMSELESVGSNVSVTRGGLEGWNAGTELL